MQAMEKIEDREYRTALIQAAPSRDYWELLKNYCSGLIIEIV